MRHYHFNKVDPASGDLAAAKDSTGSYGHLSPSPDADVVSVPCDFSYVWLDMTKSPPYPWVGDVNLPWGDHGCIG